MFVLALIAMLIPDMHHPGLGGHVERYVEKEGSARLGRNHRTGPVFAVGIPD